MKASALSVFLAVGLAIPPQTSQGQRIESLTQFAPELSTRRYPETYYFEGAAIGAGVLATTGVWLGIVLCDPDSNCHGANITPVLIGGVLGGVAGALVGGAFPAPHPRPLRGHAARAALLGTLAGAMWGFGLFTHFCLNGCNPGEVRFGLSTAAVGALAGLIVGL